MKAELIERLENCPVVAAIREDGFNDALNSPAEVIFLLGCSILTVADLIKRAHEKDKLVLVHVDLADGIGKDKAGIEYLTNCSVDGIISTRSHLIRAAKECGIIAVQRFFALDSQGVNSVEEVLHASSPTLIEIMPGVAGKVINRFANGKVPVIAGGLIETKAEVMEALSKGALAVSTGKKDLWYI
ncbi:MAG: glycerol-3-phosphate responsive antiterminator [Clostridia bacterium]|nr:glycerol-3-phosphate responsive antiterminator [Clostridia bacterium]